MCRGWWLRIGPPDMIDLEPLFAPVGIDALSGLSLIIFYMLICMGFAVVCVFAQVLLGPDRLRWQFVLRGAAIIAVILVLPFWKPATNSWTALQSAMAFALSLFALMLVLGSATISITWLIVRAMR